MSKFLRLSVAEQGSPTKNYKIKSIRLPGYDGEFGIMAHRAPIMGIMEAGIIHLTDLNDKKYVYATTGGFYEMLYNKLTIIFDTLFYPEDITEEVKKIDKTYKQDMADMSYEEKKSYVLMLLNKEINLINK